MDPGCQVMGKVHSSLKHINIDDKSKFYIPSKPCEIVTGIEMHEAGL
jgi:hypothetical protein